MPNYKNQSLRIFSIKRKDITIDSNESSTTLKSIMSFQHFQNHSHELGKIILLMSFE